MSSVGVCWEQSHRQEVKKRRTNTLGLGLWDSKKYTEVFAAWVSALLTGCCRSRSIWRAASWRAGRAGRTPVWAAPRWCWPLDLQTASVSTSAARRRICPGRTEARCGPPSGTSGAPEERRSMSARGLTELVWSLFDTYFLCEVITKISVDAYKRCRKYEGHYEIWADEETDTRQSKKGGRRISCCPRNSFSRKNSPLHLVK